jgi:hypothetical protein
MNKKGFLFTFITIFMLFSLVVLTYDYLQRNKNTQDLISGLSYSNRLNFMRENIVSDYFSMLDITLDEITRDEDYVELKFSSFSIIKNESVYPNLLQVQKNFTENKFSNLSNVNILLQNYIPEFLFFPYDTSFVIDNRRDSSNFFIYINDFDKFIGMEIDIKLNNSITELNSTYIPSNTSTKPYVIVNVYDIDDNLILENITGLFDSTTENDNFEIKFNKIVEQQSLPGYTVNVLQNIIFSYGRFTEHIPFGQPITRDATFYLKVKGIEAEISKLHLKYNATIDKAVLMTKATVTLR